MQLSELLKAVNGGGYKLILKFENGYTWSANISTSMNLKRETGKFLLWNFGQQGFSKTMKQQIECLQIVADDDNPSNNKLYIKLSGSKSERGKTCAQNVFVDGNITCIDRPANSTMIIDHKTGQYDEVVLTEAVITFPDHDRFIPSDVIMYFANTGSQDVRKPISALNTPIEDLPDVFKNEKIEKLSSEMYMAKYRTTENIAHMIQAFASIPHPNLESYNILKLSNSDRDMWSNTKIASMPIPAKRRISILTWLSKYLNTTGEIATAFRWNMRGLPLEQCIRRQWAITEHNWVKKNPDKSVVMAATGAGTSGKPTIVIADDDLPF